MSSKSGENRCPCLIPDLKGCAFNLFITEYDVSNGPVTYGFYYVEVGSLYTCSVERCFFFCLFFCFICLFRAAPAAYEGSQARGLIRAVAVSLHHSHSDSGSELCLRPTPQLTATPDP